MGAMPQTEFLLDSGDPNEYKTLIALAKEKGEEVWGSTTNPSLIAKKLAGKKITREEAFKLQKEIVLEILSLVPGAVSAEVYADQNTKSEEMIEQGIDIGSWHERVVVKLPTNFEGLKARSELRKQKIPINNTLVFSQQQIFAICLHEKLAQAKFGRIEGKWPPFISPFVGRLDDIGENGMDLVRNGMEIKETVGADLWMLEASVRKPEHIALGIEDETEILTAPFAVLSGWFNKGEKGSLDLEGYSKDLRPVPLWSIPENLRNISSLTEFFEAIEVGSLDISHELTEKGLVRFADDWKQIISE
jgi:transaldolase